MLRNLIAFACLLSFAHFACLDATSQAQILYDHLFKSSSHDIDVRPVSDPKRPVIMYMNLSLAQLLEVEWKDENFQWNPDDYGGVKMLYIPSGDVWVPDLVLYNNGGGTWDLGSASNSKVKVWYDGTMQWKPPIIFYAQCDINVEFFPFDVQTCFLKMGTWTHNGLLIDLRHSLQQPHDSMRMDAFDSCPSTVDYAIDISDYISNGEWDLLEVSGKRNIELYPCCPEPYLDITFNISLRRKTLFYGANLISPCIAFALLVPLVFYLPSGSNEKCTLCVSIFLIVLVFLVVLFDLTPATSLVVPLMVKYLLFTMLSTVASIVASTIVLNIHLRMPDSNQIPKPIKTLFLHWLPNILQIKRPPPIRRMPYKMNFEDFDEETSRLLGDSHKRDDTWLKWYDKEQAETREVRAELAKALYGVRELATILHKEEELRLDSNDWQFIAFVVDRVLLVIFSLLLLLFTAVLFLTAPSIFDNRKALTADMADELLRTVNYTRLCGLTI